MKELNSIHFILLVLYTCMLVVRKYCFAIITYTYICILLSLCICLLKSGKIYTGTLQCLRKQRFLDYFSII